MLVLPAGESIRVPPAPGVRAVGTRFRRKKRLKTCRFGETELVGPLPPRKCWPKGIKPLRAVVAEPPFGPSSRFEEKPYRIHLFFGSSIGAFKDLEALAKDVDGIHGDVTRTLFGDRTPFAQSVFYTENAYLHGAGSARLDSWLCTVQWWAWRWTECPFRTKPKVVYAGNTYETDPSDDAVASKLAFSIFDADVLTASAATLSMILRFCDEPPEPVLSANDADETKEGESTTNVSRSTVPAVGEGGRPTTVETPAEANTPNRARKAGDQNGQAAASPGAPALDSGLVDQRESSRSCSKGAGGKKPLRGKEARDREQLIEQWNQAKGAGVSQKEFCNDKKVELQHLTKCINWAIQRRRREESS